jgi:hypothetical protein
LNFRNNFNALWNPGASGGSPTQVVLVGRNSNPDTPMYPSDKNNFGPAIIRAERSVAGPENSRRSGYGITVELRWIQPAQNRTTLAVF